MKLRITIPSIIAIVLLSTIGCKDTMPISPTASSTNKAFESPSFDGTPTLDGLSIRATQRVETVVAIQTASTTPLPTDLPEPTSTLNPIELHLQNFNVSSSGQNIDLENFTLNEKCKDPFSPTLSPDGAWFIYNCPKALELLIIKFDGSVYWLLNYNQLSSYKDAPENISVNHWSNNDKYVYFVPSYRCCWDPQVVFLGNPIDELWQFSLETGKYINVMSGFDYVSFSPDDTIILLIPQMTFPPLAIDIYDVESHKVTDTIRLSKFPNNSGIGNVVWATDSRGFVVLTASGSDFEINPSGEYKQPLYSVILIELNTLMQKTIVSESKRGISLLEVNDSNILKFYSYDLSGNGLNTRTEEQYNLTTNQFTTATPIPTP